MEKTLLNDATSSDDNPTPGYMLNEIARSTIANYTANVQLQDFLVSRLTHKNHNVKWKCLVVIKHVCRTGRPEFKREMARKVDPIKECTQFRGTPDPIRGDELNKRVRDAAKEALDAIFDSQMSVTTSAVAAANRIQGMGNDYVPETKPKESSGILGSIVSGIQNTILKDSNESSYMGNHGATGSFQQQARYNGPSGGYDGGAGGSGKYTSSSSSGMTGIGNPNFQDARNEKSWMQKASEAAQAIAGSAVGGSSTGSVGTAGPVRSSGHSDYNYATNRGSNAYGSSDPTYNPRPMNAFASNSAIGGFNNSSSSINSSNGFSGTSNSSNAGIGRAGAAASDGTYEKAMIDALCEPGGLKPVPPEDKLQEFLLAAGTLSVDVVGNCLADNLQAESWQTRIKTLIVIASLVKATSCQAHADWWVTNAEEVRALLQDSKANVRTQTVKTLKAMGVNVVTNTTTNGAALSTEDRAAHVHSPKQSSNGTAPVVVTSLLDDFDEPAVSSPVPVPAPVPSTVPVASPMASASNGMDMFADVQFTGNSNHHYNTVSNSSHLMYGNNTNYNNAPPPVPTTALASSSSMFDGLAVGGSSPMPTMAAPPAAPSVPTGNSASSAFDFLDSMGSSPAPAPTVPMMMPMSPVYSTQSPAAAAAPAANNSNFSIFDALDNTPLLSTSSAAPLAPVVPNVPVQNSNVANGSQSGGASSGFSFLSSPVSSNPADAISSSFTSAQHGEKSKEDAANASFAALSASFGLIPTSSSSSSKSPMAMNTTNQMMMNNNGGRPVNGGGVGMMYGNPNAMSYNAHGNPMMMNMAPAPAPMVYNPNVSPLAPSMLGHNAPRKSIPDTQAPMQPVGPSGFSFIGTTSNAPAAVGQPQRSANNNNNDSFDFVSQAMRGMNK